MRLLVLMTLVWILGGCATNNELVVLLPGDDGKVGALDVSNDGGKVALTQALAAARAGEGNVEVATVSEADVQRAFSGALNATPPAPASYILYFRSGTTSLADGSQAELDAMLEDARSRAALDIQVTGHTDRVGPVDANDRLALKRARSVMSSLVNDSDIDPAMVRAVGRGEREPLVPTADEVSEARNRRVQITVR